jgi:hypothetical protein
LQSLDVMKGYTKTAHGMCIEPANQFHDILDFIHIVVDQQGTIHKDYVNSDIVPIVGTSHEINWQLHLPVYEI